jgi:aspartyl protease family protein
MLRVLHLSYVLVLLLLAPGYAQIYKWTDRTGRVHFTDTIAGIPPEYRTHVEEKTSNAPALSDEPVALRPAPERSSPASKPAPTSAAPTSAAPGSTVPLRREGNARTVAAVVDGAVQGRLLLDTGAEFTVLSPDAARLLSLNLSTMAVIPLRSASGVFWAPMTKVRSIAVGEAVAFDVEVVIHDATPGLSGLLGMSFLEHFDYAMTDTKLSLTPWSENAGIEMYGGHTQEWWRRKFRFYRTQIDSAKRYMGVRYAPEFERSLRYFRTELETLNRQASQAGVPRHWRD